MKSNIKTMIIKGDGVKEKVDFLYFTPESDSDISKLKQIQPSDDSIPGDFGITLDFVLELLSKELKEVL